MYVWVAHLCSMTDPTLYSYVFVALFMLSTCATTCCGGQTTHYLGKKSTTWWNICAWSHRLFCTCSFCKRALSYLQSTFSLFTRFGVNLTPKDPTAGRVVVVEEGSPLQSESDTFLPRRMFNNAQPNPQNNPPLALGPTALSPVSSVSPRVEHRLHLERSPQRLQPDRHHGSSQQHRRSPSFWIY